MKFLRFARDFDGRDVVRTIEWQKEEWPPPGEFLDDFGMIGPEGEVWTRVSYSKLDPVEFGEFIALGALYVPQVVAELAIAQDT